jgi:hypothetical protein
MADCGQYYKCTPPSNYTPLTNAIVLGVLAGTFAIAAAIAGSAIPGYGIVAGVLLIAAIFTLCDYLSGGKLVCLGEYECTIGRIMRFEPVGEGKSGFERIDDDFCINSLPSPHSPVEKLSEVKATDPDPGPGQGRFMVQQQATKDLFLPWAGNSVQFTNIPHVTEIFHLEVKGCRVHDVCLVWKALSFGAPVVGFICTIPIVGWLACLIVALIWLVITAVSTAIAWAAAHSGDINDVYDPAAGELKAADPNTGDGGDVILTRGDWVYDAGHDGWNEIQPVRSIQKLTDVIPAKYQSMAKADANLVAEFKKEVLDVWCYYSNQASDPVTHDAQDDPENNWHIHPSIDGCDADEPPEVPK